MRQYQVNVGRKVFQVNLLSVDQGSVTCEINGESHTIEVSSAQQFQASTVCPAVATTPTVKPRTVSSGDGTIRAPMPGIVVQVLVKEGDSVALGSPVAIMEAMKMENTLTAPKAGTVRKVFVKAGGQVESGAEIVNIQAA